MPDKTINKKPERHQLFQTVWVRINLVIIVSAFVLMAFSLWLLDDSMNVVGEDLINFQLESSLDVLIDNLKENAEDQWEIREDGLYIGNTLIGDGTVEGAYRAPFVRYENLTGAYFSVYMKTDDEMLMTVTESSEPQSHYIRISGSNKGRRKGRLEGTYMDEDKAIALDESEDGTYTTHSMTNGSTYYSRYEKLYNKDREVVGVISSTRRPQELATLIRDQKQRAVIQNTMVVIMLNGLVAWIVYYILRSLTTIRERLDEIAAGKLDGPPLNFRYRDELSDVADSVNDLTIALRERQRLGAELELATNIQTSMLPREFPPFPDHDEFDLYASMTPAKEVGGDFYDYYMLDDHHLAIVVADVSGKGVPAAFVMAQAKALIKNLATMGNSPAGIFTNINQMLLESNEAGMFVTAWMGVLNLRTGKLTFVNAGHNLPLIKLKDEPFTFLKSTRNFVLAGIDGISYRQHELHMEPGDQLFLYTDGVTEATNTDMELYGNDRLANFINAHKDDSVQDMVNNLHEDIHQFVKGAEQSDDITMLILKVNKEQEIKEEVGRRFDARVEALPEVMEYVEEELDRLECPLKMMARITVIVEEIFINIAQYAYTDGGGTMRLAVTPHPEGGVMLRFSDTGKPFNPLNRTDPDITLSAEERDIGGLGIFMMKQTMDEVKYKYENGHNVLVLVKKFEE
ncbi:MAG: SpoIIE family protein phosphatase [Erysipelotrichaceae bacterium]|nr:SpoIIE family protein phosphatase [Erysipelotrichaceae bacterium]